MKELEDHPRFPSTLRNFQTEFIGFAAVKLNLYMPFINYLNSLSLRQQTMYDLCSGSGEPAISIFKKSTCFRSLVLSDKFPNPVSGVDRTIYYKPQSADVREMKFTGIYCYTMFNAFHHFSKEEKLRIVRSISAAGAKGFFVEILQPNLLCFLQVLFASTIGNLLLAPFVKPFSFKRLFFTYIIPLNIFTILLDGIISVAKSQSLKEYWSLFSHSDDAVKVFKLKQGLSSLIVIQVGA